MTTKNPRRPRGFTLVELLVVISIIGVLAAILVPTLYRVVVKARQTRIAQELSELHKAMESYKQKFGDYPPDFTTFTAGRFDPHPSTPITWSSGTYGRRFHATRRTWTRRSGIRPARLSTSRIRRKRWSSG